MLVVAGFVLYKVATAASLWSRVHGVAVKAYPELPPEAAAPTADEDVEVPVVATRPGSARDPLKQKSTA